MKTFVTVFSTLYLALFLSTPAFAAEIKRAVSFEGNIDPTLTASIDLHYQSLDKVNCHYDLFEGQVCTPNARLVTVQLPTDSQGHFNSTINTYSETGFGPFKERFEMDTANLTLSLAAMPALNSVIEIDFAQGSTGEIPIGDLHQLVFDLNESSHPQIDVYDTAGKRLSGTYLAVKPTDGVTDLHLDINELQ